MNKPFSPAGGSSLRQRLIENMTPPANPTNPRLFLFAIGAPIKPLSRKTGPRRAGGGVVSKQLAIAQ